MQNARTRTYATNGLFAAFILALLGWGLAHAWAVQAGMDRLVHGLLSLPGLALCAVLLVRYARHWPARLVPLYRSRRRGLAALAVATGAAGVLFFTGLALALAVVEGSAVLLVLAALVLALLPWTRLSLCRDHFFLSTLIVGAGTVGGLDAAGYVFPEPQYATGALACLCMASLATVFIALAHGGRYERMPATGYGWMTD
jgi:hypothetical protein